MDTLTKPQLAVVEALVESRVVNADEVHPSTLKWLIDNDWVINNAGVLALSESALAEVGNFEVVIETIDPPEGEEEKPDEELNEADILVNQILTITDKMTVQVDAKGTLVTIPAGTDLPVFGYTEDRNKRTLVKWFTCLYPEANTLVLVNALRNRVRPIEPKPLSSFRI